MKSWSRRKVLATVSLLVVVAALATFGRHSLDSIILRSFTGEVGIMIADDFEHHVSKTHYSFVTGDTKYRLRLSSRQDEKLIYRWSAMRGGSHAKLINVQGYLIGDTLVAKVVTIVDK